MRLVLFGPPGAGKGSQAKRLSARFDLTHVSTGDLFRAAIKNKTELGQKVEAILAEGALVPDEVTNGLVKEKLKALGYENFVLDGFPRTLPQVEWLLDDLEENDAPLMAVVSLRVPEDNVVQRLSRRRTDTETGEIYHLDFNPPPGDIPEERLVQRPDDQPEAIRKRIAVYEEETKPLEAVFEERSVLLEVDGTGDIDAITERIVDALGALA